MNIYVKKTGCRLNQHLAERLISTVKSSGDSIVKNARSADTIIIAGCIVTGRAESSLRRFIKKTLRENPGKRIILTGCIPDYLKMPGTEFIPQNDITQSRGIYRSRTRRDLFIQTGCNNFCSYCIVPYYRGAEQSRPLEDILRDIEDINRENINEIILTGVHIARYNHSGMDFNKLLEQVINSYSGLIRLSSLDINEIDSELLETVNNNDNIAPFLHLSLQHTETGVLKRMHRHYSREDIAELFDSVMGLKRHIRLGADIIAGFPGETDSDFDSMLHFLENSLISHYHIFRYSRRPGTLASFMDSQVDEKIKRKRMEILTSMAESKRGEYIDAIMGKKRRFIAEYCKNGYTHGTTEDYLKIQVKEKIPPGTLSQTTITPNKLQNPPS